MTLRSAGDGRQADGQCDLPPRVVGVENPVWAHGFGWNRSRLDLRSDEVLAQILDRGDMAAWRELFALATEDEGLRARIHGVVHAVPLPYPAFWMAALAALGEPIDWDLPLPQDDGPA